MKKFLVLILVAGAVLVWGGPRASAVSGYIFYNKTAGDWTVMCWRDVSGGNKACRMSAPPELLAPMAPQNLITITEFKNDSYRVVIEVRDRVIPGLPAFVRIDDNQAHEAPITNGLVVWEGEGAVTILKQMHAGRNMVFRVHTAPEGLPRDIHVALGPPFAEAFTAYRQTLRAHGLIGG